MISKNRTTLPLVVLVVLGILGVGTGAFFLGRGSGIAPQTLPSTETTGIGTGSADKKNAETASTSEEAPLTVQFGPETLKLANLEVISASEGTLRSALKVTGSTEPNLGSVVKITPRVAGNVTDVRVNVGDTVQAGQVLATVASLELANAQADYDHGRHALSIAQTNLARQKKLAGLDAFSRPQVEAARTRASEANGGAETAGTRVAAAEAGVAEARDRVAALKAALVQSEAQATVAKSRFDRAEKLLKEEIVSRQDYEQSQADWRKAEADVDASRAAIAQGNSRVTTASALLRTAQVERVAARKRSEIASQTLSREEKVYRGGYVASKEVFEAQTALVEAQHELEAILNRLRLLGGTPGGSNVATVTAPLSGRVTERTVTLGETVGAEKELFTVINLNTVWVQLSLYQKDAAAIRPGWRVAVTADSAPGQVFRGKVAYIGDAVDPASRTVKVRCLIQNAGGRLKPGTFVTGEIEGAARGRVVLVPQDAVQDMRGKKVVFVSGSKDGEFVARPVTLGERTAGKVHVARGLLPGERIVTKNAFLVKSQAMKAELAEE